ncbi:hypothetical protein JI739_05060 [Ramlibacter sp. AW1]|uniref:Uncharacterized protein n=2 Tax=Ramlibacter aurantiacus TaxID=2801330 RepID=A0A936ZSA8_9BURK|nr:hypothetical protein [Ramlibacter aurantiacus]
MGSSYRPERPIATDSKIDVPRAARPREAQPETPRPTLFAWLEESIPVLVRGLGGAAMPVEDARFLGRLFRAAGQQSGRTSTGLDAQARRAVHEGVIAGLREEGFATRLPKPLAGPIPDLLLQPIQEALEQSLPTLSSTPVGPVHGK